MYSKSFIVTTRSHCEKISEMHNASFLLNNIFVRNCECRVCMLSMFIMHQLNKLLSDASPSWFPFPALPLHVEADPHGRQLLQGLLSAIGQDVRVPSLVFSGRQLPHPRSPWTQLPGEKKICVQCNFRTVRFPRFHVCVYITFERGRLRRPWWCTFLRRPACS